MTSTNPCRCLELGDLAIIGMGHPDSLDDRIFETFDRVQKHGGGQWWLYASICRFCRQGWMIAQEERIHDNYFLRRIDGATMQQIVENSLWPTEFTSFENVLRLERDAGQVAHFIDPQSPALIDTVADLCRERPDISIDDISYVLAISYKAAARLTADRSISIVVAHSALGAVQSVMASGRGTMIPFVLSLSKHMPRADRRLGHVLRQAQHERL